MHLDEFQRIVGGPGSVTVIRYTDARPFVLRLNDTGGDLAALRAADEGQAPQPHEPASDAAVGGGAGS